MTRYLHAVPVPETGTDQPSKDQSKQIASEGLLDSDIPAVESVAPNAGTQTIAGVTAGAYSDLTASELNELFSSNGIEVVPFYGEQTDVSRDGYYALEDAEVERQVAKDPRLQSYSGTLTHRGTIRSHRRAVRTAPSQVANPFGAGSAAEVGIPAVADRVQWFDDRGGSGDTAEATVQRTVETEHGRVDIYDATEPSFSNPALVYRIDYSTEYLYDMRVWDDYGREKLQEYPNQTKSPQVGSATVGSATVGSASNASVVSWQRCYKTDHDYDGTPIIENGRVRLVLDEDAGRLRVYRWSETNEMYELFPLGQSAWRLSDVDLWHIGVESVDAQLEFSDGGSSYRFNMTLKRGYDNPIWIEPDGAGGVPGALINRLDPIAHESEVDPGDVADIVERSEVDD